MLPLCFCFDFALQGLTQEALSSFVQIRALQRFHDIGASSEHYYLNSCIYNVSMT
jgi:hypothetical protein